MITDKIVLSEKYPECTLTSYIHGNFSDIKVTNRRAIVVFPGGGYSALSEREGEPVALQFFAAGFNAFVLRYSICEKAVNYAPMIESALAVKYIRENAEALGVDPNYVFVCGFSAGGHLAAASGSMWNVPAIKAALGDAPEGIGRPTGTILGYPVITSGEHRDTYTLSVLCTGNGMTPASEEDMARFSAELFVDSTTPPAFIWATAADDGVEVQNSLIYAGVLSDNNIPFELHIYQKGCHGLALANEETWCGVECMFEPSVQGWIKDAARWASEL